uniref:RalBP1-associated Eps domain-containing protein 2 n=1 Tax=Elaeophora elaphi TaxID=1147741 RepID=A0A158Q8F5_9BILA
MTETAVHQNPAVVTVASPVHTPWEVDAQSVVSKTLSTSLERRHPTSVGDFPNSVSISLFQNESRRVLLNQNVSSSVTHAERKNPFETSDNTKEEFASSSDDYLSDRAEVVFSGNTAPSQGTSPGIRWKALNNSDEETSDGSDEVDGDTDEEGSNDKAGGMSDTETKNLLEDAIEDEEESDLEDSKTLSSDRGRTSKPIQDKSSSESLADSLYGMSEEQKAYYTKCFNHLMKKTAGYSDVSGAICGANEYVVEFFKRSGLNREKLSKIWSLSDVNEDGYLDLNEFSTAMHLIVLHIKGHIPIPDVIPFEISPPVMPRRDVLQSIVDDGNNRQGTEARAANTMQDWKQFDYDDVVTPGHCQQQHHSFSDEHLHVQLDNHNSPEKLSNFSDVPPLLVDVRPTALKATQPLICAITAKTESSNMHFNDAANFALSPQAPKGPPPKPPPRPVSKGHGRSASLDLNSFQNSAVATPGLKLNLATEASQRGATLPAQGSLRHPCSSVPSDTMRFSTATEWQDPSSSVRHPPAPPLPPRSTFVDVSIQTDDTLSRSFNDGRELIELNLDMEKRIEELLAEEGNASASGDCNTSTCGGTTASTSASTGQVNWQVRCDHLRLLNSHLEAERAKLAQIRLQLELRLQEATGNHPSMKPTSL